VPPRKTKAERVYSHLRGDILAGRLRPGQRLPYTELCEHYQTSMGVLRESMLRLAEQGLVRGESQQGFQVTPLSAPDLIELTDVRVCLETTTLRRAMTEGDVNWEANLVAAHHRLSRAASADPDDPERVNDSWVSAHADFHDALLDGCSNRRLKSIAAALRDSSELYRSWSLPLAHGPRNVAGEHTGILSAVVAGDVERAVALLTTHIERTTKILLASLDDGANEENAGDLVAT
jgi:DNA-binding GntR family transcriptional regulator